MAHIPGHNDGFLSTDFDIGKFLLEQTPRAAFFNAIRPQIGNVTRERFFNRQQDPFFNRFAGQIGGALSQNRIPTQTFADFLPKTSQEFDKAFFRAPRFERGTGEGFLNPRTRFLPGF